MHTPLTPHTDVVVAVIINLSFPPGVALCARSREDTSSVHVYLVVLL